MTILIWININEFWCSYTGGGNVEITCLFSPYLPSEPTLLFKTGSSLDTLRGRNIYLKNIFNSLTQIEKCKSLVSICLVCPTEVLCQFGAFKVREDFDMRNIFSDIIWDFPTRMGEKWKTITRIFYPSYRILPTIRGFRVREDGEFNFK